MPRALIAVRLSRVTDATTSPERQLATCRELCEQRGYEVVGIAEDLDVSAGSTTPFDRPQLGDWLTNRLGEFDVIVFFRADRIVRRLFDLSDLIRWSREHSVTLVSATETHFDLSTQFGDIIALLVAKVAEMELAAISERNSSAARYNLRAGKYRGGIPPWGYLPQRDKDGDWRFAQDPEQVAVINEVVRRVLDGEPLRAIAHDLTARGVQTTKDRFAAHQGREAQGYAWHSGPLKRALTSPAMLGQVVTGQTVAREDDGSPIIRAAPILTREVFDRLSVELSERENRREPTKRSTGLLLQIIHCGVCERPAYRLKGGAGRNPRYRCSSAQYKETCGNRSVPLAEADEFVTGHLLDTFGDSDWLERVWDSGSDHSPELEQINATLVDLTGLLGTGPYVAGTPQRIALNQRIAGLAGRQAQLSAEEVKPAGWTWQPTGENFGERWARQDVTARNVWLRSMGVKFTFDNRDGANRWHLDLGDLKQYEEQLRFGVAARVVVRQMTGE